MYIQKVLVCLNLDILHEDIGADGGIAWSYAQNDLPEAPSNQSKGGWCPPLSRVDHVAWIKRDPIKAIASCIENLEPTTWGTYAVGEHPHKWSLGISSYMEYVKLAEARLQEAKSAGCQTHKIQVEQSSWCEEIIGVPRNTNTRLPYRVPTVKKLITMFKDEKEIHSFLLDECKNAYVQGFLYPGGH